MPDILRIEAVLQDVRLANLIKSSLNATSFDRINSESSKFSKQVNKLRLLEKGRKRLQRMKTGLLRVAALINLLMIDDEVGFLLLEEIANRRPTIFEKLAFQELRRASLMFGPNARQIGELDSQI